MTKMNRRDYLLQMGAGAAGLVAASRLNVFAENNAASAHQQRLQLRWIPTPSLPANPRVTVIFGGLLGFFYSSDGNCEIGDLNGHGQHRLTIEVWERRYGSSSCKLLRSTKKGTLPKPNKNLQIEIVDKASDVNCYEVGEYSLENRKNLVEGDFRWLPDLDSNDFYPQNLPKLNGLFRVKSILRHGTLYTYQRTSANFWRVDPSNHPNPHEPVNSKDFYHVAQYTAAAIKPADQENVSLQIDGHEQIVLRKSNDLFYQIIILNHCYKNPQSYVKCEFPQPAGPNEIDRNDFHHVRDVLQIPGNGTRYGLKLKDRGSSSPTFCPGFEDRGTDEAPCMGAAFGQTTRMP